MSHKDKKKKHQHSHRPEPPCIDIDIDLFCEPTISERDANLIETLYSVNRSTADLKTATALWGIVAHAKHRHRQQCEQLRKQQNSAINDIPAEPTSKEGLTSTETVRVIRGLLQCNDNITGQDNKRIVVSAIFDILRCNPSIMKRYPKFAQVVKSKCLEMITQHHLDAAQKLYDQQWGKDLQS